jgi:hypothetical protein
MTTMTMQQNANDQASATASVQRVEPVHTKGVSQLMPMLVALVLLVATGLASVLISGPMH